ncbi:hypothetical protein [Streptomyces sp. URMC 125]|uniref:hypothetical protein n=1 Tax=Streptomyces sp. URMC 125 TaxID=3423419 RepID=UPI003F1B97F2
MSAAEHARTDDAGDVGEEAAEHPHLKLVAEPGKVASFLADLRPYLPTRANLAAPLAGVGAGTRVLIGRGWTWLWKEGPQDAALRAGGVVLAGYAGVNTATVLAGPYLPFLPTAAVVGWCVAAKLNAPKTGAAPQRADSSPEGEPAAVPAGEVEHQEHAEEAAVEVIEAGDVAALIRAVAARHKHQGAHLEDLLAEPLFEGWTKSELKAALSDDWGLPVESFKLIFDGRQRVRDGVRLKHLPPVLRPVPDGTGEGPAPGAGEGCPPGPVPAARRGGPAGPCRGPGPGGGRAAAKALPDRARGLAPGAGVAR